MTKQQLIRYKRVIKSSKKMKPWQKQIARPVISCLLDIRKEMGAKEFHKTYAKKYKSKKLTEENKILTMIIEYIATGKKIK